MHHRPPLLYIYVPTKSTHKAVHAPGMKIASPQKFRCERSKKYSQALGIEFIQAQAVNDTRGRMSETGTGNMEHRDMN